MSEIVLSKKAELLDGTPPGTIAICHPSGWIQSDIFVHWLTHFIDNVKPTKDNPVLLLLDGHSTHTKNLPLIDKARENGVIIISFPPHCTHRLQPLDVSIMGPLSTYYSQEVMTWLRNNPGRTVTQFQLGKLFGTAYAKAATLQNALSGFSKTGVCPLNPNIFSDHDFVSATTTDNDLTFTEPTRDTSDHIAVVDENENIIISTQNSQPTTSNGSAVSSELSTSGQSISSSSAFSPADILPKPRVVRKTTSNARRGKTAVITSSPYKMELEKNNAKKTNKKKNPKQSSDMSKPKKKKNSDEKCIYCTEIYGNTQKSDDWVQCLKCKKWAHESCTGWEPEELDEFHCSRC